MRPIFAASFVLAVIVAGGYWYRFAESKCDTPVYYALGTIDERFALTPDAARAAITDAESLWEDATSENLFTYDAGADFKINFVFDARQETAVKEAQMRSVLDLKEGASADLKEAYQDMVSKYEVLKKKYEARVALYEKHLAAYNADVERWNTKGGAPQEVYTELNERQKSLQVEMQSLNKTAKDLNALVEGINKISTQGTEAVEDYNKDVAWYNDMFGHGEEFAQGEYLGDRINIYQYDDVPELKRVLAHELGHALSLDHVAGATSIMHYLMEGKNADFALSTDDVAEYKRVCGAR